MELELTLQRILGPDFRRQPLVVAVSGGIDSMVLAHQLLALAPHFTVAHFNHRLRGRHSDLDAKLVRKFAEKNQLAYVERSGDGKAKSEAALREERRHFLKEVAIPKKAMILTAHHANDNLETVLFRLLRGTGLDGLAGIPEKNGLWVRPFLNVTRAEISSFAHYKKISYREDHTNALPLYARNKIRAQLAAPLLGLSSEYGGEPSFFAKFNALMRDLRMEKQRVARRSRVLYRKLATETAFWTRLREKDLRALKPVQCRQLLRLLYRKLTGVNPSRRDLERLEYFGSSQERRIEVFGLQGERSCGHLFFMNPAQVILSQKPIDLDITNGKLVSRALGIEIDLAKDLLPLEPRFFRAGDRVGNTKLKKILLESRIPQPERKLLPLLCQPHSNEVQWYLAATSQNGARLRRVAFSYTFQSCLNFTK